MLLRVEDLNDKEREHIVVSMTPHSDTSSAGLRCLRSSRHERSFGPGSDLSELLYLRSSGHSGHDDIGRRHIDRSGV